MLWASLSPFSHSGLPLIPILPSSSPQTSSVVNLSARRRPVHWKMIRGRPRCRVYLVSGSGSNGAGAEDGSHRGENVGSHPQPWRCDGKHIRHVAASAMHQAAQSMQSPADLISAAVEVLVKEQCELPAFSTLERLARRI